MNDKMCPVCGYEMTEGPRHFNICPSCGTEFGLHDENATIEEIRNGWLATGPVWYSHVIPQPAGWEPITQLINVFLNAQPDFTGSVIINFQEGTMTGIQAFPVLKGSRRGRSGRRLSHQLSPQRRLDFAQEVA